MYLELKENKPHGTKDYPYTQYHISNPSRAYQIPIHWHDELEIIYVRKGTLSVWIDGQEYTAIDNSVYLVSPGQLHLMGTSNLTVDYYTILFPMEFVSFQTEDALERDLMSPIRRRGMVFVKEIPKGKIREEICEIIERIIEMNNNSNNNDNLETRINLLQIISLLVKNNLLKSNSLGKNQNIQKEMLTYIQQNYLRQLTLKDLSDTFHFSQKYISRFFKENFHITLFQYVNYLRLNHAKHLLETTDLSVTEISLHSGFSNVSYFIRSFKKSYGLSPLQYRKQ